MRVVLVDDSDGRELGGDVGAIGARPDASAISRHGGSRQEHSDYVTDSPQPETASFLCPLSSLGLGGQRFFRVGRLSNRPRIIRAVNLQHLICHVQ